MLLMILTAAAAWLALIFGVPEPERRDDREWHGRNAQHVPPPVPGLPRRPGPPSAADAQVR